MFSRLELNFGKENIAKFQKSTVVVIGIGGVGSYVCEALARNAIGKLVIIDNDIVDKSNINRQLIALHSTIGMDKVKVMKDRIRDINPECEVIAIKDFYNFNMNKLILNYEPCFIVDACDTVSSKLDCYKLCLSNNIKFISAMGAARKTKPEMFEISILDKTSYDPLAKVLRKKVKEERLRGKIPVVYSKEIPQESILVDESAIKRKDRYVPSSNSFTPSVSGLLCASFVINSIVEDKYVFN